MGLIGGIIELLFGSGRNVVKETAEVFRENAEAGAERTLGLQQATLAQFAEEFGRQANGFDRVMDGINRIPRPALALSTLALFITAMSDPVWFARACRGWRWCRSPYGGCWALWSASILAPATKSKRRTSSAKLPTPWYRPRW